VLAKQTCRDLSLPDRHQGHMPKTQGAGRLIRSYISRPLIRDEVTTVQQLASSRRSYVIAFGNNSNLYFKLLIQTFTYLFFIYIEKSYFQGVHS